MDVKSAYLYGKLDDNEIIYMKAPPGIDIGVKPGQVLRLKLALYGLKQAGRRWYMRFREIMTQLGFKRSDFDHAVFYRVDPFTIIFIHVDDMTLVTKALAIMQMIKKDIGAIIEVVDSGEIHWMLGIEIRRSLATRSIHLSQRSYIDAILSRYGFADIKPLSIPFDPHIHLTKDQMPTTVEDIAIMRNKPYREALGALQYLSVATRPDITHSVSILARFSQNPGIIHWNAVKRVYVYLKYTRDFWLSSGAEQKEKLVGYTDVDEMSQEDRHAIPAHIWVCFHVKWWCSVLVFEATR
jgi:hypothetical protein